MSYAEIRSFLVQQACEKYLSRRKLRIELEREFLIQEEMKGGWFSRKKTREQAIRELRREPFGEWAIGKWAMVEITGSSCAYRVEQLLALSNAKGVDKIMVNAEDAYLLGL